MRIQDFTYELPQDRIAQEPPKERGNAKLLVIHRENEQLEHRSYSDLIDYLEPGDLLVLNNTKVIKARLLARNTAGNEREILILERHHDLDPHRVQAIYRGKLHTGEVLNVGESELKIEEIHENGTATVTSEHDLYQLAARDGHVPLPPYMKRDDSKTDQERYQTVFAKETGSVAAPTASLNLTEALLERIRAKGVQIAYLTLHVGIGTFMPIKSDSIEDHVMHSEYFEVPQETINLILNTKRAGNKVTAVGTTVTRTLEYTANQLEAASNGLTGEADIFIYPGYKFQVIDQLLTNFHAPKSTVLMLAAAFAGWPLLEKAYQAALSNDYKFLSYGDSTLIV